MEKQNRKSNAGTERVSESRQFWRPANLAKIFVSLSIVFICGAFFFIRSEAFLNWVEGQLEAEIRNRLTDGYTVDIGKIKGNILGSVTITGISISKENEPKPPIVSTGKVVLKYNLFRLLTRRFEVKNLEVSEPQIHAVRYPDDSLNLTHILKDSNKSQDTSLFDFAAGHIRCNRGKFTYFDAQQNLRVAISDVSIRVNGELNTWNHDGELRIGKGSFTLNGAETAINNFDADFVLLADQSRLENFYFAFGKSELRIKADLRQGENGNAWNAVLNLELDVSDVQQFFDKDIELDGVLEATLEAEGTNSALDVKTFVASMPMLSITNAANDRKIALAELEAEARLMHSPSPTFELTNLSTKIAEGALSGSGSIILKNTPEGNILAQLKQLTTLPFIYSGQWHAAEIQVLPFLSIFAQLPEYLSDSRGHLSGTASFTGDSTNLSSLKLHGEATLAETTLNGTLIEDSTLNCTIEQGELKANANFDEAEIEVTGIFPLGQQDFLDIHAVNINIDKLTQIVNTEDIGGTGTSSAKLSSSGSLEGSLEVPNATFNNIPLGVLTSHYRYEAGKVFIENGSLTKSTIGNQQHAAESQYKSHTTINGTVEVKDDFPADFSIVADPVYIQHYPKLLLGAEHPIDGKCNGELKLDGTLTHLDGRADFRVTDSVAWGVHLDPLILPLRIEDYNISITDFKITTRGQQITMNITVAANGELDLLLQNEAPIRFEEIAKAANITDFPFEGGFDVRFVGALRQSEDADFRVELGSSDITYLDAQRGVKHLLGDATLLGKLIERKNTTGEADIYDFQGHGFDATSQISGTVSMEPDNPYRFVVESTGIDVAPFLRILHPTLNPIIGTADGHVSVRGKIADLAPTPTSAEPRKEQIYPYDVDIYIATSQLRYENPTRQEIPFTNAEPIRLHLRDDKWTIEALRLATSQDDSAFIQLAGTFNAKTEAMDLRSKTDDFALRPFAAAFGIPEEVLQTSTARYELYITGTPELPVVEAEWAIPTLTLKTEIGEIYISDASGGMVYQENVLTLDEKCAFKIFGNDVSVGGYIDIQPENVNRSELHLRADTIALDLTTFPIEVINELSSGNEITGSLEASLEIGGTIVEPHAILYAETAVQQPIRIASYIPSITLERLRVDINIDAESVHIQTLEANGQMGAGPYRAKGEAVFSRQQADTMLFELEISASQLEIGDYGIASGEVKLSGTSLEPHEITVVGKIDELVLDGYDLHLTNNAPLQFRSDPGLSITGNEETLAVEIQLQITSSLMNAALYVSMGGSLENPAITAAWNGTLNQKEWKGNVQYSSRQIEISEITLKDNLGKLTLTGVIPFDLTFTVMDISERLLTEPINLRLQGRELPLDFFPNLDILFSETDGTVDIDLALQGTSRVPHIAGSLSVEAQRLVLTNFHEPIQNMSVQLTARENVINIKTLQFKMGSGYGSLQEGQLILSGLVPEEFRLKAMRFERFPLGSTVAAALPPEAIEDIQGHLTARLETLIVPLNSFFAGMETIPLPQIREIPSLVNIAAVSTARFSIDSVRLAFKAFDRHYDFQDPQPTSIVFSNGIAALANTFNLQNQETFLIKQTFSSEDRKPDGLIGEEQIVADQTTLSVDAGSTWKTNGEFDIALRVANFDVSALTDAWPPSYRVTGVLSGTLQLSGTSENPKITLRRHASDPAELYLQDVPIDLRWRVRYQNGKWEISTKRYVEITFGENLLTFSGTIPYQLKLIPFLRRLQQIPGKVWQQIRQTPMNATLDVKVKDLNMLPLVVRGLGSATGRGDIHVELTGTIEAPQAIGSVFFNGIDLEFPDTGISVKEMEGEIRLSEKGANITECQGKLNNGNFSIQGHIAAPADRQIWQTPPVLDLSTNVTEVVFEQPETYKANLDFAELRLHGELLRPYLTGSLRINSGYYQQNWEIVQDWLTGVSIKEADVALANPILQELHLDIDVDIPSDFRVLSSITGPTDIEIACLGKLIGPINQPVFSGNVSVQSGKIGLITQPFEFIEGSRISNRSTFNFNPDLNISLRTPERIRGVLPRDESIIDIQVYAAFTGTLNNPNFTLSAPTTTTTEVLTHEEIIAFLIRNAAFSRTLGGLTFSLQRPFEEDARSIIAEYPLTNNMSIKIETNDRGEHGVDIEFKGRF